MKQGVAEALGQARGDLAAAATMVARHGDDRLDLGTRTRLGAGRAEGLPLVFPAAQLPIDDRIDRTSHGLSLISPAHPVYCLRTGTAPCHGARPRPGRRPPPSSSGATCRS